MDQSSTVRSLNLDLHGVSRRLLRHLHSNGCSTILGLSLGQSLLIKVSMFLSFRQLSMSLAELGQVESSNLLSFLNLLFVRLDLSLESINKASHTLLVLPIIISIGHFLDAAFSLAKILHSITQPAVFSINFGLQLTNPSLHLIHCFLASLQSIGLSIIQTGCHILDLAIQKFAVFLKALGNILLSSEFLCKASGNNHCLLCLFVR